MTQAPYCLFVNTEVNVRLLSRSDVKASVAPSNGDGGFSLSIHCHAMPCLISMHDMQEFTGEHLYKLALSFWMQKADVRQEHWVRKEGNRFREERGVQCSIAQPVYEKIFGRLPKNVMRTVWVCDWPLPIISCPEMVSPVHSSCRAGLC